MAGLSPKSVPRGTVRQVRQETSIGGSSVFGASCSPFHGGIRQLPADPQGPQIPSLLQNRSPWEMAQACVRDHGRGLLRSELKKSSKRFPSENMGPDLVPAMLLGYIYVWFIYILGNLNEQLLHFQPFGFTSGIFFLRKKAFSKWHAASQSGNPRNPTFRRFPKKTVFWSRFPYQFSQERMDVDTPSVTIWL